MQAEAFLSRADLVRNTQSDRYKRMLAKLREARIQAELKQADVALALGKRQSFVSKCESGERRIDPVELADFARLYGKSIDHFLE